jgi:Ketopantoate hydroxymethyltransferase
MTVTIRDLQAWKTDGTRFAMLTAYDFPTAKIFDEAGIPVLLVGDSVGNNVLGYENTLPVTMEEMLHHTRAVARGVTNALVVGDMPFLSYQVSVEEGVRNAGRFLKEGGARAVKIEGAQIELVHKLVELGIPVMAHVGLTPQSVHAMGGYRVQGRGEEAARVTRRRAHEDPADPNDRDRCGPGDGRPGARLPGPARLVRARPEVRARLRRPAWRDREGRRSVRRRRRRGDVPGRGSLVHVERHTPRDEAGLPHAPGAGAADRFPHSGPVYVKCRRRIERVGPTKCRFGRAD